MIPCCFTVRIRVFSQVSLIMRVLSLKITIAMKVIYNNVLGFVLHQKEWHHVLNDRICGNYPVFKLKVLISEMEGSLMCRNEHLIPAQYNILRAKI